jgi:hypothetical protein
LLRAECNGTCVTFWTGDIRYKSLAGLRARLKVYGWVSAVVSKYLSSRRDRGNVGIPEGFPKSVGRVGSRLHGSPCFPHSVISMACSPISTSRKKNHAPAVCGPVGDARVVSGRKPTLLRSGCRVTRHPQMGTVAKPLVDASVYAGERV